MRHWNWWRGLRRCAGLLVLVCSVALWGCGDSGDVEATVGGIVNLTATNAAALGGLTFDFPDATLFGFPGQSTTLAFGPDGTTFILATSSGTVIEGSITFGSCILTQNLVPIEGGGTPFAAEYDTCAVTGKSDNDIPFGGSGDGTLTLQLGRAGEPPTDSAPARVIYHVTVSGQVTINANTTPIGVIG